MTSAMAVASRYANLKIHEEVKMLQARVDLLAGTVRAINCQYIVPPKYQSILDDALRQSRVIEDRFYEEWDFIV